jgi:hypothetical protein
MDEAEMKDLCQYMVEHQEEMMRDYRKQHTSKKLLLVRVTVAIGVAGIAGGAGYILHIELMYKGVEFVAAGFFDKLFAVLWPE